MAEPERFRQQRELIRAHRQALVRYGQVKKEAEERRRKDHAAAQKALQRAQQTREQTEREAQRQYHTSTQAAQEAYEHAQTTAAEHLQKVQAAREQAEQILSEHALPLSFPEVTYSPEADTDALDAGEQLAEHTVRAQNLVEQLQNAVNAWQEWRERRARRMRRLKIAGVMATILIIIGAFLGHYQVRHTLYRRAFDQALQINDWQQASQVLEDWSVWAAHAFLEEPLWGPTPWQEQDLLQSRLTDEITQAMEQEDWQRARAAAEVLQHWNRNRALYFLAQIELAAGNWRDAAAALEKMAPLKKGSMRLDDSLHVVLNGLQGTICSGIHLRKLSFFSRAKR